MKYISLIALFFSLSCWADDPLEVRNPHNLANFVESEHFVFYWGEGIASDSLTPAFETLEYAWQVLIEQRGFKRPPTSEQYKFNVYISGTGQPVVDDFESALPDKSK